MDKLKPCPFCGDKGELLVRTNPYITSYVSYTFVINCYECGSEGSNFDAAHNTDCREAIINAIESWNKRDNG